jgi:inorganic pyrophosphatase
MPSAEDTIEVLVEIPKGSRNKYERDPASGLLRLDRVLYASVHYPAEYGFVIGTRAPDGEPLDALVIVHEPTFPGCVVPARPIGLLDTRDEQGIDHKILAVPIGDPRFDGIRDLGDLEAHWLVEIEHFFASYKLLEGIATDVLGWQGATAARTFIAACRTAAEEPGERW